MSYQNIPKDLRGLRACLGCSLIKSFDQFENDGCDNCDFLRMKHNSDNVMDCTSKNFDGMIACMNPEGSWVAKWQRVATFVPGMYAISVSGALPNSIVREMKRQGIPYRNRDTSGKI
ncbi:transcription elongation factor SPT4-like [Aethina tumida]|uniref:transcription elongation factor SPT4-like n=1 Tax=Aethina tumida TaxID=116153 RepID=UPI00096AF2DF|nr:transcription elongation factor SPT4-like [Aethina tumida]